MAVHVVLPWIHRANPDLKTWALGVYHGLRPRHTQSYLGKIVLHLNHRRTRPAAFCSLLEIRTQAKSFTYKMLISLEAKE